MCEPLVKISFTSQVSNIHHENVPIMRHSREIELKIKDCMEVIDVFKPKRTCGGVDKANTVPCNNHTNGSFTIISTLMI